MTFTIPDHVGKEAVRLLNEDQPRHQWTWPIDAGCYPVITVAKLLMDPPAPMTDPDEEAALRVFQAIDGDCFVRETLPHAKLTRVTEQMRKEFAARKEAWEAGR